MKWLLKALAIWLPRCCGRSEKAFQEPTRLSLITQKTHLRPVSNPTVGALPCFPNTGANSSAESSSERSLACKPLFTTRLPSFLGNSALACTADLALVFEMGSFDSSHGVLWTKWVVRVKKTCWLVGVGPYRCLL